MIILKYPHLPDEETEAEAFASAHWVSDLLRIGTWTQILNALFRVLPNIQGGAKVVLQGLYKK